MKLILIGCLTVFGVNLALSQDSYYKQLSAIMIVHADLESFYLDSTNASIDDIKKEYTIREFANKKIYGTYFYKINSNYRCDSCFFIIAYGGMMNRFYKLQGFQVNEFSAFFYQELLSTTLFGYRKRFHGSKKKYLLNTLVVEDVNFRALYKKYHRKVKNSHYDDTSCYRKRLIIHH